MSEKNGFLEKIFLFGQKPSSRNFLSRLVIKAIRGEGDVSKLEKGELLERAQTYQMKADESSAVAFGYSVLGTVILAGITLATHSEAAFVATASVAGLGTFEWGMGAVRQMKADRYEELVRALH